jgi:LysR family transcriptional activator of nhaA
MDRVNFNHLFYFYVVATTGSIKEASERIHVTQPTISDQIKLLEEHFGSQLFDRKNRSLILNREGKVALGYAEKIFSLSQELTARLRNQIDMPKRSLDIGITSYMSQYFLYETIFPLFNQKEIAINLREGERNHLLADLVEGVIDIMFTDSKETLPPSIQSYRIGVNRTFVVAHKKFLKYGKDFPKNLNRIPFFHYTYESSLKGEINLFFANHNLNPKIIGEGDDIDLFKLITEKGLGFTIVPEAAKVQFCKNKNIIALGELVDLQTSVWGLIKNTYKGLGHQLLNKRLNQNEHHQQL